jgi:hypothetical protein
MLLFYAAGIARLHKNVVVSYYYLFSIAKRDTNKNPIVSARLLSYICSVVVIY